MTIQDPDEFRWNYTMSGSYAQICMYDNNVICQRNGSSKILTDCLTL